MQKALTFPAENSLFRDRPNLTARLTQIRAIIARRNLPHSEHRHKDLASLAPLLNLVLARLADRHITRLLPLELDVRIAARPTLEPGTPPYIPVLACLQHTLAHQNGRHTPHAQLSTRNCHRTHRVINVTREIAVITCLDIIDASLI